MPALARIESIAQDLRHGLRQIRLNPGFALTAVLSLALGIGANAAVFWLLDAVRLRTLPVPRPHELVQVELAGPGRMGNFRGRNAQFTNPLWETLRDRQQALDLFAWGDTTVNLSPAGEVRNVDALWVSGSFFSVLGVRPAIGRFFTRDDDRRGCGEPGAVISAALWQREFGGRADVLSRRLRLGTGTVPVIGVAPPEFFGVEVGRRVEVALPICAMAQGLDDRMLWFLSIMGRLRPGWSLDRARAHLASLSPGVLEATVPAYGPDDRRRFQAMQFVPVASSAGVSALRTAYERPLIVLMAMVALVLLIACANVANLMLARATARTQEFAVRLSMGASRGRLVQQLLTESLLLATLGGVGGVFLAWAVTQALVAQLSTPQDPIVLDLALDTRIIAFTLAISCLTVVVFGIAPALRAGRTAAGLRAGGRGMSASREKLALRRLLLTAQVALCLVLLVGGLLFVRSFGQLATMDLGFRPQGLLVVNTTLPDARYPAARRLDAARRMQDLLAAMPGVSGVARAYVIPVSGFGWDRMASIDQGGAARNVHTFMNATSPGYFDVMEIPFVVGRDFTDRDMPASPRVAIVNEEFARRCCDGRSPIGLALRLGTGATPEPTYEIVGVVKNSVYRSLKEETIPGYGTLPVVLPLAYVAAAQEEPPRATVRFILRTAVGPSGAQTGGAGMGLGGPPESLIQPAMRVLADADPELSVRFAVLTTQIDASLIRERLMATLSGCFAALATILAVGGLYGVVAYMVARRRNEIGVRMALGAGRARILRLILGEVAWLMAAGLTIGLALSLSMGRTARAILYGLEPHDPVTLVTATVLLATVGVVAAIIPARRAVRIPPTAALREP